MKLLLALALSASSQELLTPLEDITISAPAVKVPVIDPQIHGHLLRLLQQRMDARPDTLAQMDASIGNLNKITTVTGYRLKTRYTELGFLLTEGLAGVKDLQLVGELERVVRQGTNVQTRAAAMVALAYTRDMRHMSLFQGALNDQSVTVRLAAVEALTLLGSPAVQLIIGNAARADLSPMVQAFAAEQMWRMGDIFGREILLRLAESPDWFVRAMAVRPLGELGGSNEYQRMQLWLNRETHPSVKVELLSAMMRLRKFEKR